MRASEALPPKQLPKITKAHSEPIKVSDLMKRRHAQAAKDLERAINDRENTFIKLARLQTKIWKLARQVQRYERLSS